jgi:tetratricopeptide (TPR) repeat protein
MRLEAEIALAEGDAAAAAERFEAALSLDPDWIVALSGLAHIRYAEGNLEQAERHLREVVKSRDHSPGDENLADWVLARYWLARIHDERGDLDAARERYNEFLALWNGGDRDVPEITGARERLGILGRRPRVGVR